MNMISIRGYHPTSISNPPPDLPQASPDSKPIWVGIEEVDTRVRDDNLKLPIGIGGGVTGQKAGRN